VEKTASSIEVILAWIILPKTCWMPFHTFDNCGIEVLKIDGKIVAIN